MAPEKYEATHPSEKYEETRSGCAGPAIPILVLGVLALGMCAIQPSEKSGPEKSEADECTEVDSIACLEQRAIEQRQERAAEEWEAIRRR